MHQVQPQQRRRSALLQLSEDSGPLLVQQPHRRLHLVALAPQLLPHRLERPLLGSVVSVLPVQPPWGLAQVLLLVLRQLRRLVDSVALQVHQHSVHPPPRRRLEDLGEVLVLLLEDLVPALQPLLLGDLARQGAAAVLARFPLGLPAELRHHLVFRQVVLGLAVPLQLLLGCLGRRALPRLLALNQEQPLALRSAPVLDSPLARRHSARRVVWVQQVQLARQGRW